MKILFSLFMILFLTLNASIIYTIPLQKEKTIKIKKAIQLYQYNHDLNVLNKILFMLYKNQTFKEASETAEFNIKNNNSLYTYEFIENLLTILNGINPTNSKTIGYYNKNRNIGGGYLKYIKDKLKNYIPYIANYPVNPLITKNFDYLEKEVKKELNILNNHFNNSQNVKSELKIIIKDLIIMLSEVKIETNKLKEMNIIKPFNNYDITKYLMPKNWAQTDGKTTLSDILNFIINGDKKYHLYGIKDYYNKIYNNDLNKLIIIN